MKLKLMAGETEQLALIDDALDDASERNITADEARMISETARREFDERGSEFESWQKNYLRLRVEGWSWRVAVRVISGRRRRKENWRRRSWG